VRSVLLSLAVAAGLTLTCHVLSGWSLPAPFTFWMLGISFFFCWLTRGWLNLYEG